MWSIRNGKLRGIPTPPPPPPPGRRERGKKGEREGVEGREGRKIELQVFSSRGRRF